MSAHKNYVELSLISERGWNFDRFKLMIMFECLKKHDWNRIQAAKALGVSHITLRSHIKRMKKRGFAVKDNPVLVGYQIRRMNILKKKLRAKETGRFTK